MKIWSGGNRGRCVTCWSLLSPLQGLTLEMDIFPQTRVWGYRLGARFAG